MGQRRDLAKSQRDNRDNYVDFYEIRQERKSTNFRRFAANFQLASPVY